MGHLRAFLALLVPSTMMPAVASTADAPASAGYVVLDDEFSQLREDFNRAKGSVRLLFVVDPICPGCLRGMDDMNKDLLSQTKDARLKTFVVHVPVIGAKAKDVMPAARLLENSQVRNYWNASGEFGRALAKAVELKNDKEVVYAWDVWLLYGPDTEWVGTSPPQPKLLMHQLWKLESTRFQKLDSKVFAREARALVANAPALQSE
jgi:protein-disulfide isomerase